MQPGTNDVRRLAAKLAGQPASDYQITFCAMKAGRIPRAMPSLDDLPRADFHRLHIWLKLEHFSNILKEGA